MVIAVLVLARTDFMRSLELVAYDFGVRSSERDPSERVAVIAIDDKSIENIWRWPWPRSTQAELIGALREASAKVIGNAVFYIKPDSSAGKDALAEISAFVEQSNLGRAAADSVELSDLIGGLDASEAKSKAAQDFFAGSAFAGPPPHKTLAFYLTRLMALVRRSTPTSFSVTRSPNLATLCSQRTLSLAPRSAIRINRSATTCRPTSSAISNNHPVG